MQLRNRFPQPYWVMDAIRFIETVNQQKPVTHFALEVEGQCVGAIGLTLRSDVFAGTAQLGFWLGAAYWNKGITSEAVQLLVPWIWEKWPLQRLEAGVYPTNPASMRVLEKAGFHLESIQRNAITKAGQVIDYHLFVLLRP